MSASPTPAAAFAPPPFPGRNDGVVSGASATSSTSDVGGGFNALLTALLGGNPEVAAPPRDERGRNEAREVGGSRREDAGSADLREAGSDAASGGAKRSSGTGHVGTEPHHGVAKTTADSDSATPSSDVGRTIRVSDREATHGKKKVKASAAKLAGAAAAESPATEGSRQADAKKPAAHGSPEATVSTHETLPTGAAHAAARTGAAHAAARTGAAHAAARTGAAHAAARAGTVLAAGVRSSADEHRVDQPLDDITPKDRLKVEKKAAAVGLPRTTASKDETESTGATHAAAMAGAAHAAALAGASRSAGVRSSADVHEVDRSLDHIDPQLRSKVETVIERMATEQGKKVELVEGYRSPARQQYLYEQGRTRVGPVVTWTRDSLHSQGRAADLRVEGAGDKGSAYSALQRIAEQEGLETLGMKDPGHVQLPTSGKSFDATKASDAEATDVAAAPAFATERVTAAMVRAGVARVAAVAHTASVARAAQAARPAGVARVATVAQPGAPAWSGNGAVGGAPGRGNVPVTAHAKPAQPWAGSAPSASTSPAQAMASRPAVAEAHAPSRKKSSEGDGVTSRVEATAGDLRGGVHTQTSTVARAQAPVATNSAAGVERALEIRDALEAANPSSVAVRLDGTGSAADKVRVTLMNRVLDSAVSVSSPQLAARLESGAPDLVRALGEQGLAMGTLSVHHATAHDAGMESLAAIVQPAGGDALKAMLGTDAHMPRGDGQGTWRQDQSGSGRDGSNETRYGSKHQRRDGRRNER